MKIFGRSRAETREILSRLKPKKLTEKQRLPVGYYSGSGTWRYRNRTLPQGTIVFVTPEGKPFLKEQCGNPLVMSLSYPKSKPALSYVPITLPESLQLPPMPIAELVQPSPGALAPPGILPPVTSWERPGLAELFAPEEIPEAMPEESPGLLQPPGAPNRFNPAWLALLLPLAFLGGGHHHPGPPPPIVVPEGPGWMTMGAGVLVIGLMVGRRRRVRTS